MRRGTIQWRRGLLAGMGLLAGLAGHSQAQSMGRFVMGGTSASWVEGGGGTEPTVLTRKVTGYWDRVVEDTTNAPGNAIGYTHRAGWISPLYFDGETNIASRVLADGGTIVADKAYYGGDVPDQLIGVVNGDHEVAFERKPTPLDPDLRIQGVSVVLDFGRPVGIHRIRFYPRNTVVSTPRFPFHNDYLKGYEVWVNPAETGDATPDLLVERKPQNQRAVVDIEVAPQQVRLVTVRSLVALPYEIDEIEVYGAGFMDHALYLSDIIDLGEPATIGPIRWTEEAVGDPLFSRLDAHVRTGRDSTPILYREVVRGALGAPRQMAEVSPSRYYDLEVRERAPLIEDLAKWSLWKAMRSGELIGAPVPSRYVQVQLDFHGNLGAARQVGRLWFDYVKPPVADTLWAEVYPRRTEAEKPATFRYAVRLRANSSVLGYDRLAVDTPVQARDVRGVALNGRPVEFAVESTDSTALVLRLPLVENDGDVLELTFDLPIFRFGTTFSGRAWNSDFPTVPQAFRPGDAASFGPDDVKELSSLFVAIPEEQIGKLVGRIEISSPILTPNGDHANDELELKCNLLQLIEPAPVELLVLDLAGRGIATIAAEARGVGPVTWFWDGRGSGGDLVAPGIYVWVLRVRADAFTERHAGTVAVVY